MKKLSLLLLVLINTGYCSAQSTNSKGIIDCKELKFWISEVQDGFKNIHLTTVNGDLTSIRGVKGFDTTEYRIMEDGAGYQVKGVSWRFKNKQASRVMFQQLVKMVNVCNLKFKQSSEGYSDYETNGYAYFQKLLPQGKSISIELKWNIFNEEEPENAYQNLFFTIYYSK